MDSRFARDVDEEWGSLKAIGFDKIIDPKEVASVTFGNKTIVLQNTRDVKSRITVESKAANCSVALPEEVKKIVSVEEKKNVKNADFHCKESYAIFLGEKDGARMPLFSIHRIKKNLSEQKLEKTNPMMIYIETRGGETYTIEYGEIQSQEQNTAIADIMNRYIDNILPFVEIMK